MKNLQEVQQQITEMIKSDYPNPIFTYEGEKLIFQFDELSFHGNCEITIDNDYILLESGMYYSIEENSIKLFMDKFTEMYQIEQSELQHHLGI